MNCGRPTWTADGFWKKLSSRHIFVVNGKCSRGWFDPLSKDILISYKTGVNKVGQFGCQTLYLLIFFLLRFLNQGKPAPGSVPQEVQTVPQQSASGPSGRWLPLRQGAGVGSAVHELPEALRLHEFSLRDARTSEDIICLPSQKIYLFHVFF